ncbi:2-oxoglutarate-dependent dioxygenase [Permianibacter sp. IMCC34836]|uniref:2OG-Fe(II) oxygenase n=1 Tax=Permianibacter fluminis TaxID=2738515 RepID=UPI001551A85B|nr:2OG-Fe(II) oxygenase [Permianibacter fluminis]NQD37168.1 2-oxoglutarate-dependent dioxygenase [Permianibacter fluminis]
MRFEQLPTDLQQWIRDAVNNGHPADSIVSTLVTAGHQPAIAEAIQQHLQALAESGQTVRPHSSAVVSQVSATQRTSDRDIQILFTLNAPRIVLFGSLLAPEECDALIEQSRGRLKPSTVVNGDSGSYDQHEARTSYGASFRRGENPLIQRIEQRIAELLSIPASHGEPIQVLNYAPGAQYKPHFDYFDPKHPGNEKILAMGGQRFASLVIYLNDVAAGGSTVFPEIGLDVLPRKGGALFFSYANPAGDLDPLSLHGGSPVVTGEKWIATKWLRLNEYTGPDR